MTAKKQTFKLIAGSAAITAAIDSIAKRGARLDRDIQVAALSAMQHHVDHGDVTLTNRLIAAMPKGSRINALMAYIETFSGMIYDGENKLFVNAKGKTARMDAAMESMWTSFKPPHEYQSITDPAGLVKMLVAKLEKDRKEMGDASLVDPALIENLRNVTVPQVLN